MIYLVAPGNYSPFFIDTFIKPDMPFLDPYRNIKIELIERLGTQARIRITHNYL
ncbi:MAG: hypothetical protein WCG27_04535 [Pseudomonadota bacterium]